MNAPNPPVQNLLPLSRLARLRMRQNRVSESMVALALECGEPVRVLGGTRYRLTPRLLRERGLDRIPRRLRWLAVTVSDRGEVHTVSLARFRRWPPGPRLLRESFHHVMVRRSVEEAVLETSYPAIPPWWQIRR
jgi:hypothetical protein